MDILIIAKWFEPKDIEGYYSYDNPDQVDQYNQIHYTPAIITTMIDMFLAGASNMGTDKDGKEILKYNYVLNGQ